MIAASGLEDLNQITLVVLSRNHEKFILDCLKSVSRELSEIKILIADIGSNDNSFILSKEISKELKLNTIHIQLSENTRTLIALKSLESCIKTKYIILLSADDALGGDYANALVQIMKTNPEDKVINFTSILTDQNLKPLHLKYPKWSDRSQKNRKLLSYSNPGTAPGALIPWEILINSPKWKQPPNIIIEDYWLWWQLVDHVPFIVSQESNVLYRQHEKNISKASKNTDYAYSLGYVSAIPQIKATNIWLKLLSILIIPRWIRHLNLLVWKEYISGYYAAIRNEVS